MLKESYSSRVPNASLTGWQLPTGLKLKFFWVYLINHMSGIRAMNGTLASPFSSVTYCAGS